MSVITLTERDIEVAIRWTEVHVKKLMDHLTTYDEHSVDHTREYLYNGKLTIEVYCDSRCVKNEELIKCPEADCPSTVWVPCVMAYMMPYKDDIILRTEVANELHLSSIRTLFEQHIGDKRMCACGRLGKMDHQLESERGKCNNCYIYGFVRGEDCSICKEDDGKPWIKTSCGHCFHDMCWSGIPKTDQHTRKCPLCRSIQDHNSIIKL